MNITLNCHYCWAQFQLNVSKNIAAGGKAQLAQKENGKYMQHLALHLNAAYKCNECSYPITDTKTFFKHKQFYKHDEKTCIMVDNDVQVPSGVHTNASTKRKALIQTRLKQQLLEKEREKADHATDESSSASSTVHDRDTFKCSVCFENHQPQTAPTQSAQGASSYSFDKEQVLKHVLIVHLAFLAYKCDQCAQFYAFDEPQTKQHAALVHSCGIGEAGATAANQCHFKLIKTEEEINLAINRAQQFINKIPANAISGGGRRDAKSSASRQHQASLSLSNITLEAQPKYRCCKCIAEAKVEEGPDVVAQAQTQSPIVLYTYQDALDHVMSAHLNASTISEVTAAAAAAATAISKDTEKKENVGQQVTGKKLSFELELFEQNLEDLVQSETGVVSTISSAQFAKQQVSAENNNNNNKNSHDAASADVDDEESADEAGII